MSDIAKKTLPPGSWPGSKGARTDDASAPRSVAPVSTAKDDVHIEDGSHYTHEREKSEKPLGDIQEESSSHLQNVEPHPMSNGFTEDVPDTHSAFKTADPATEHVKEASELQGSQEPEGVPPQTVAPQDSISSVGEAPKTAEVPSELRESEGTQVEQQELQEEQEPQGTHEQTLSEVPSELQEQEPQGTHEQTIPEVPSELQEQEPHAEVPSEIQEHQVEQETLPEEAPSQLQEGTQVEPETQPEEAVELNTEGEPVAQTTAEEAPLDFSVLKDGVVNKGGIVMKDNKPVGRVVEGDLPALVNKRADANGILWSDRGEAIGKCEPLSDKEIDEFLKESSPFESFPNNIITAEGMVEADGVPIGIVKEGDVKQLRGKSCDADGEVTDRMGNVIGRCERWEPEPEAEAEPEPEPEAEDLSLLDGGIVTRAGYIENGGRVVGKVVDENFSHLVGKRCDKNGIIWLHGEAQGHARLLDESERDEVSAEDAPFESFPNAVVGEDGWIVSDGQVIGKLVSGDPKALRGRSVDAQGRISDKWGRDLGKAERWEAEPEPEPEATDYSSLAGKRVNKLGFLVDSNGSIFGRVVEGDLKTMVGRMANAKGEILSEGGIPIGRAELVSESEREGLKEGPFSGLSGLSVGKDSYVVDAEGQIVGKLVSGDPKKLQGRAVDEQGEITDSNGNVIGRAEPYTPEEEEVSKHPLSGFRVNSKGDVIDPNTGELAGKLITGDLKVCAGKLIDDEGDVVSKGTVIGHVAILSEIHDEEETETEDEKTKRQQTDEDRKLAIQMAACIEQCLDKVRPICKMITEKLDAADRKRQEEEEVDEEALVREVKPLLEEGNMILSECNGAIRALDPGGRIAEGAKYKAAARESTPEEHRLAELITTLTQTVTETLENAKRRLEGLPRAKKELNPLLGLLGEPLGQIIAGVGFLLAGVLNLVGRLLQGLGLGQILDSLLGTLGLSRVLEGLGLGGITGKKDKKKKSGGGLLGGLLG